MSLEISAGAKPGELSGTGVIRDKDGNIKAEFKLLPTPVTKEQVEELQEAGVEITTSPVDTIDPVEQVQLIGKRIV